MPCKALIAQSLEWISKRINLSQFLKYSFLITVNKIKKFVSVWFGASSSAFKVTIKSLATKK